MKLFLLLIALALCALSMEAQPLEIIWDRSGLEDGSGYGYGILALGDQNDDGFNDWAVWAVGYADPAYVEFFHGDSTPLTTPYMTITGNLYPWGAARAMGDMNGDGYVDWLLKFFGVSANIYWGGPEADTTADLEFTTSGGADDFMPIGDFNGDGYSDLYWYHFSQDFGEIYYGGMNMDTIPDWSRHSPDGDYAQQAYPWDYGNLNGDNADDFVSSTYPLHTTHIFLGGTSPDTIPAYTWESLDHRPRGVVNDLNNDGYDELVYNAQGSAEVHLGDSILSSVPDFIVDFPCTTPTSVYNAGDFNGDGFGDLILLTDECAGEPWGVLSMYLGHPWLNEDPAFTIFGSYPNQSIRTAAGGGDVNGEIFYPGIFDEDGRSGCGRSLSPGAVRRCFQELRTDFQSAWSADPELRRAGANVFAEPPTPGGWAESYTTEVMNQISPTAFLSVGDQCRMVGRRGEGGAQAEEHEPRFWRTAFLEVLPIILMAMHCKKAICFDWLYRVVLMDRQKLRDHREQLVERLNAVCGH